jgi:hypothetical protein
VQPRGAVLAAGTDSPPGAVMGKPAVNAEAEEGAGYPKNPHQERGNH